MFPTRIVLRQGGHPTLDVTVGDVQPNSAAAFAVSGNAPRAAPPAVRMEAQAIADGVWFLTGGAPLSILVEFSDHVVVIEAPQDDEHTTNVIAEVKRRTPGKPIRYLVNTHLHFDHSGGLRGFVAEGVTILTHALNKPYLERILQNPFALSPDRLARAPRTPMIEGVGDKRVLTDGSQDAGAPPPPGQSPRGHVVGRLSPEREAADPSRRLPSAAWRRTAGIAQSVHGEPSRQHSTAETGRRAVGACAWRRRSVCRPGEGCRAISATAGLKACTTAHFFDRDRAGLNALHSTHSLI